MTNLCYYIEPCADFDLALNIVVDRIPCFVSQKAADDYIEVTISCRVEDAKFVETMLAPFV